MTQPEKNIVILGSTGSIGTQTLDIVDRLEGRIRVVGLAANGNVQRLADQAQRYGVKHIAIGDSSKYSELKDAVPGSGATMYAGLAGLCEIAALQEADLVVVAVAGAVGILPTQAAIKAGKDIALASKEVLVASGQETMRLIHEHNCAILPIDSEHSALFQCIQGAPDKSINELILTASGGPFRTTPIESLVEVTPEQALKHPTWNMGGLVTINSATLMNKGLEIIEAHFLFDVPVESVSVLIHPQSIIHSMVRFLDGSVLGQFGLPDMRLPIQYALVYPERIDTRLPLMDLAAIGSLSFENPDLLKFPSITLARAAAKSGGTMPAVMNAANEQAVDMFLNHRINYLGIMKTVEKVMSLHSPVTPTFEHVLEADNWARRITAEVAGK